MADKSFYSNAKLSQLKFNKSIIYPDDVGANFYPECVCFTIQKRTGVSIDDVTTAATAGYNEYRKLWDNDTANVIPPGMRKAVEKAKGLLMKHKKITEDEAYQILRKMAMNKNKRITDVAEGIISAIELLE